LGQALKNLLKSTSVITVLNTSITTFVSA